MKCTILHESRGRMRVHVNAVRMTLHRADVLEAYLNHSEAIEHAKVYERTGDVLIKYKGSRAGAVTVLSHYKFDNPELDSLVTSADSRKINQEYQERFVNLVVFRAFRKLFLPVPVQAVITVFKAIEFIRRGLVCLWHRKLEVEVLDALSIGVSLLRSDFNTAGSVMFLLNVGALLEEWTRKKSLDDLARSMSLNVDRVWVRSQGTEVLMPITKVKAGDEIIVRSGNMVPLDGTVIEGEAMVNQAALTGESMPVRKIAGATVYAGTVVEEGECVFAANAVDGASRYDKIVSMIEESEKLKSGTENHALELADRLVPWCLAGTVVTYALTRNVTRAISILMVDFSCALKLSMPLAVLSAMRECGSYHITVKGGKYLEALSKADTIVFDKTGTLTHASPKVVKVVPFSGCDEEEVLKLAACLEEHFPHSMANAVVRAAKARGITHEEMHTEVEYIVAHGIASRVRGERVVIGSHHFVFEDEKCVIPAAEQQKFDDLEPEHSHLYLAACGQLVGVICIADPLRPEARHVLRQLRAIGVTNTVMMTGDSDRTAAAIARQVGGSVENFVQMMNDKAASLAMTGTHFANPHGLHDENHYTTAYDVYLMLYAAYQHTEFQNTMSMSSYTLNMTHADGTAGTIYLSSTDKYLTGEKNAPENVTVLGGKTGTTDEAGSCLALVSQNAYGEPLISVILHASTKVELYEDMNTLLSNINS